MKEVKVCDAIMGSGKTQSTINLINTHPNCKFVYISPYLDETDRIADGCPDANFAKPSNKISAFNFSKVEHTKYLLSEGKNIATSHVAFKLYTADMIENIRKWKYVLIIDEALDVFQEAKYSEGDVQMLVEGGYIEEHDGSYNFTGKEYDGTRFRDIYEMFKCNNLERVPNARKNGRGFSCYYWTLPKEILEAFSEVYALTYLFECQEFKYFLDINKIPYKYIGISRSGDTYSFVDSPQYIPSYVEHLSEKVHIHENWKMNDVGENRHALSGNWLSSHDGECQTIKKHLHNYFQSYCKCRNNELMWATYGKNVKNLRAKGYSSQHTQFNLKATNKYRNRAYLAYCVNIFIQPDKRTFFQSYGIQYDEDGYALSTMIQWIWRSAIRDGKEVWIYIPSKRMRTLLKNWIKEVEENYRKMKENETNGKEAK